MGAYIDKTNSWPQPARSMQPTDLISPICENLQLGNLATPLCKAHRDDQFLYFIFLNHSSNAKYMNFKSLQNIWILDVSKLVRCLVRRRLDMSGQLIWPSMSSFWSPTNLSNKGRTCWTGVNWINSDSISKIHLAILRWVILGQDIPIL
jgi:hypothetical protein